jgi:hypothetical protein
MLLEPILLILYRLLTVFIIVVPTAYLLVILYTLRKEIKSSWPQILGFLSLTVVFFNKLLFKTQSLAQKDANNIFIPFFNHFAHSIKDFYLPPIWNTLFCGGFDVFSNPLSGYFSTFNWVFLIGNDIYRSFNFYIFFQIFLCLLFSYLMLRNFLFSKGASFFGALIFSFNAFVIMRLSPGVGVDYLFAYKWIPLLLLFTTSYFRNKSMKNFLCLALVFALSMEGNLNIVVVAGILWLVFLAITEYKTVLKNLKVFLAPILGILVYAIKVLPSMEFFFGGYSRFEGKVEGWRAANLNFNMFPSLFFPVKNEFSNAMFTPGLVGIIVTIVGIIALLVLLIKNKKFPVRESTAFFVTFLLGFLMTVEECPFYGIFHSLPFINKITVIPTFLIFFVLPITFFATYGITFIQKVSERVLHSLPSKLVSALVVIAFSLGLFVEILTGPSLFGSDSYSFNFAKMDYAAEIYDFPYYKALKKYPEGIFLFRYNPTIFNYPYAQSVNNLTTLNYTNYFYGCNRDYEFSQDSLDQLEGKVDYVLSIWPITHPGYQFLEMVSTSRIKKYKSFSIYENIHEYGLLVALGWDYDLFMYKSLCKDNCNLRNLSKNPVSFEFKTDTGSKPINTSINYSKWWVDVLNSDTKITKDIYGLMEIVPGGSTVKLYFVSPYIIFGFLISLAAFVYVLKNVRKD